MNLRAEPVQYLGLELLRRLIQELLREVNTVGSKADDLDVSQAVLAAKGVIEKMREQVQNLE